MESYTYSDKEIDELIKMGALSLERTSFSKELGEQINSDNLFVSIIEPKVGSYENTAQMLQVMSDVFGMFGDEIAQNAVQASQSSQKCRIIDFKDAKKRFGKNKKTQKKREGQSDECKIIKLKDVKKRVGQIRDALADPSIVPLVQAEIQESLPEILGDGSRNISLMSALALLVNVDGHLYDLMDGSYLDLDSWHINFTLPISEVLEDDAWELYYVTNIDSVAFSYDGRKLDQFADKYSQIIDESAALKIFEKPIGTAKTKVLSFDSNDIA